MIKDPDVIEEWLRALQDARHRLNKWECDFVDSVTEQFERRKSISDKQEEILERIYEDRT